MNEGNQETSAGITPARRLGGLLAYRWTLTFEKNAALALCVEHSNEKFSRQGKCGPSIRKSSSHQQKRTDQYESALRAGRLSVKR
jgi:hypothetical protein